MSQEDIQDRFYNMRPNAGEDDAAFVLRVDRERMVAGVDHTTTYHAFTPRLSVAFRTTLNDVRRARRAARLPFAWEHVVEIARDTVMGNTLVQASPEPAQAAPNGTSPAPAQAAPNGTAPPARPAPVATVPPTRPPTTRPEREPRCTICKPLGAGMDGHRREWCYCDPDNRVFKPEILARRIREAEARGLTVP